MADIPEDAKRRIVEELAAFKSPPAVRAMMLEEYELDLTVQVIGRYDATKGYCATGETLRQLFHQTRKEYVEGVADLHVSHLSYRLRRLQALSEKAEGMGDFKLAGDLIEQAAKDHGGVFTNVRQLAGSVEHNHKQISPDEAREKVTDYLNRAVAAGVARAAAGEVAH